MSATQAINIAPREFIAKVRNRWFVVGTLLVPIFMSFWMVIPNLLTRADIELLRIAVVDVGTGSGALIADRFRQADGFTVEVDAVRSLSATELEETRASLQQQIVDESLDG